MKNNKQNSITSYLLEKMNFPENCIKDDKFVRDKGCFKNNLKKCFGQKISCKHYEQVVFGEGNEQDKIDTVYSSSLQSLLIFSRVSTKRPLIINKITYDKVWFEVENEVIGTPSSIDVVLVDEKGEKALFIESKLFEVVRDSNKRGTLVIGPSYLSNHKNGYHEKLHIEEGELSEYGIELPIAGVYGNDTPAIIKQKMLEHRKRNSKDIGSEGYIRIGKKNGNDFVYSYGIKQILSHVIGILNFESSSNIIPEEVKNKIKTKTFVTIINGLPKFDAIASKKIENYKKHANSIIDLLSDKKLGIELKNVMTYQDLFERVENDYFDDMKTVVDFYHLKKGEN